MAVGFISVLPRVSLAVSCRHFKDIISHLLLILVYLGLNHSCM